ncbi:Pig2p [Saccharomyces cerevisiae YJM326]|nr:Pig2p [Saccharomyces cerevisiae YJM326]AJR40477.1 Pig2p [Saccharomyces cerevisiae YJM682]AJR40671.1 Pig2p [Saccharomyces cerevisiae YJM683]AJR51294.1 Pig2p [Saccharomyces cerevisiae YJM1444]CAI4399916.1 ABA_G0027280.mRNA.1.CDS.1 [Saccharomyces cerevisiae]
MATTTQPQNILMDEPLNLPNDSAHNNNYGNINANIRTSAGMSMHMHPARLNSLEFLHKPRRLSNVKLHRLPQDELQRNTDMNKGMYFNGKQVHAHHPFINSGANFNAHHQDVSKLGEEEDEISPLSHDNFQYESEENGNPSLPIYKKSGELVKSSLKRRSKSLPITPKSIFNKTGSKSKHVNLDHVDTRLLQRSKSVHFDRVLPIKLFNENEKPIDVGKQMVQQDVLNFKHKPLTRLSALNGGSDSVPIEDLLSENNQNEYGDTWLQNPKGVFLFGTNSNNRRNKKKKFKLSDDDSDIENDNDSDDAINRLVRQQDKDQAHLAHGLKNLLINDDDDYLETRTNSAKSGANLFIGNSKRIVGLYNKNFPILSDRNRKSLKLNIFLNLSRGRPVFLQEITLLTGFHNMVIIGKVFVKNIYFDKKIIVRYTWDAWRTFHESECVYFSNANGILPGSNMDIFKFSIDDIHNPNDKDSNISQLEFCIQYLTWGVDRSRKEYWDNNDSANYKIDVVTNETRTGPTTDVNDNYEMKHSLFRNPFH